MTDHAADTLDHTRSHLPAHDADRPRPAPASPAPTPSECLLTWLVLTLFSARGAAPPARSARARPAAGPHGAPLTTREIEVLRLVTLGLTNAQIAERLFVSRRTIDQHVASIYNRLGVSSRAAATRFAMLNDLCASGDSHW